MKHNILRWVLRFLIMEGAVLLALGDGGSDNLARHMIASIFSVNMPRLKKIVVSVITGGQIFEGCEVDRPLSNGTEQS